MRVLARGGGCARELFPQWRESDSEAQCWWLIPYSAWEKSWRSSQGFCWGSWAAVGGNNRLHGESKTLQRKIVGHSLVWCVDTDICEVSVLLWQLFWNLSCFQCYQYIKKQFEHSRNFVSVHVWFHPQEVLGECLKRRLAGPSRAGVSELSFSLTHTHTLHTRNSRLRSHVLRASPITSSAAHFFLLFFLLSLWLHGGYSPTLWIFTNAVIIINNHTIWCNCKFRSISQVISDTSDIH